MSRTLSRRGFVRTTTAAGVMLAGTGLACGPWTARPAGAAGPQRFWAYSLNAAARRVKAGCGEDETQVQNLGFITRVKGLLVDPATADCIVVGEHDPTLPGLQLADLVVMLRSVFLHEDGESPGVTIDPNPRDQRHAPQRVRYFGHVERTRVGHVCFDADYLMKKIGLALTPPGVAGVPSYFDLACKEAQRLGAQQAEVLSRFWYYPVVSRVVTLGNGVLLDRCELAVLCQVLAATVDGEEIDVRGDSSPDFHHQPSERFAASFTEHFDALAARWPAIAELRSLSLLAALARGLGRIDTPPHLDYWLEEYRVPAVNTPQTVAVLSHTAPWQRFEVFGGVVLEALSLRLKQGDLTAFSGAILQARPSRDALVWSLYLTPELHLVVPPVAGQVDAAQAYARGHHLFLARQYDPAIACWLQVARTYPELGEAYLHIGRAFERKGMPAAAADYYTKALEHDPFVKTQRLWNRSETPVPEKEKVP